jgi:hypothetical protein
MKFDRDRKPLNTRWVLEVCSALIQVERYETTYIYSSMGEVMDSVERESVLSLTSQ